MAKKRKGLIIEIAATLLVAALVVSIGLSLALLVEGKVVVGVIHAPLRGEPFAATVGGGATLDGRPIRVAGRFTAAWSNAIAAQTVSR